MTLWKGINAGMQSFSSLAISFDFFAREYSSCLVLTKKRPSSPPTWGTFGCVFFYYYGINIRLPIIGQGLNGKLW